MHAELNERLAVLRALADGCRLCPRRCGVKRLAGETGFCGVGGVPLVASAGPHFGEEPPLVGRGGSGTIFLGGCNLGCVFCQNHEISHGRRGYPASPDEIAALMRQLEARGCHNINFVTPTHVVPWLAEAIVIARQRGCRVPIVYNCGGYESIEAIRLLEGLVEIYMPDAKFLDGESAKRYCKAADYPEILRPVLKEMQRQVGDLQISNGVASRGLLIRHLVMPDRLADSRRILEFIAGDMSPHAWVNVMDQYRPCYKARSFPEISRRLRPEEFQEAYMYARQLGLNVF